MNPSDQETTITKARIHWGIFVPAIVLVLFLLLGAVGTLMGLKNFYNAMSQMGTRSGDGLSGWIYALVLMPEAVVALPLLVVTWSAYAKSEIILTTKRLVFRTGLLSKTTGELPLENVESIILSESLVGQFLGYGTVMVTSIGGFRFPLSYIGSPQAFHSILQKAVADAKSSGKPVGKTSPPPQDDDSRYMPRH